VHLSSDRNASSRRRSKQVLTPTGCVTPYSLGHARHQSTMISATSQIASGSDQAAALGGFRQWERVAAVAPAAIAGGGHEYRAISARPNSRRFKNQAVWSAVDSEQSDLSRDAGPRGQSCQAIGTPHIQTPRPLKFAWGEGGRRRFRAQWQLKEAANGVGGGASTVAVSIRTRGHANGFTLLSKNSLTTPAARLAIEVDCALASPARFRGL